MGSCYSNLSAANLLLQQQSSDNNKKFFTILDPSKTTTLSSSENRDLIQLSLNNTNNINTLGLEEIELDQSTTKVKLFSASNNNYQVESVKITPREEKLNHSSQKSSLEVVPILKTCNSHRISSAIHQKCLKNTRIIRNHSPRSPSFSSSTSSTPKRSKSPLQQRTKKDHKKRKLFRRIRDKVLLRNKTSTNQIASFNKSSADDDHINLEIVDNVNNDKQHREILEPLRTTTLIQTYQVSFVPEVSELLELVLSSSDNTDEEDEKSQESQETNQQVQSRAKDSGKNSFLRKFHLTKSDRWRKWDGHQKDKNKKIEERIDEENLNCRKTMSQLKSPSTYTHPSSSNFQTSTFSSSTNNNSLTVNVFGIAGNKVFSSGFVKKKTEQLQQKFNINIQQHINSNNMNGNKNNRTGNSKKNIHCSQPSLSKQQSSKLPSTNIQSTTTSYSTSSIFRGLRSRIPSMASKSTGNVNGQLNASNAPKLAKTGLGVSNSNKTSKSMITDSILGGNLTKPISTPALSSNNIVISGGGSTSSSCSSSSFSLNLQPKTSGNRLPPVISKLPTSKKPTSKISSTKPTGHGDSESSSMLIRKSSSSNLSPTDPSVFPALELPSKPSTTNNDSNMSGHGGLGSKTNTISIKDFKAQITQTLMVPPVRTQQAQIIPITSNAISSSISSNGKVPDSQRQFLVTNLSPDLNRIGIPMKPSLQLSSANHRQQQRINFLYGEMKCNQSSQQLASNMQKLPHINSQQTDRLNFGTRSSGLSIVTTSTMLQTNSSITSTTATHINHVNNSMFPMSGIKSSNFNAQHHYSPKETIGPSTASSNYYRLYNRLQSQHQNNKRKFNFGSIPISNNSAHTATVSKNLYRAVPTTVTISSQNSSLSKIPAIPDKNLYRKNTEDLNGNLLHQKPTLISNTSNHGIVANLEDFFVSKNAACSYNVHQPNDNLIMTKRRIVNHQDHHRLPSGNQLTSVINGKQQQSTFPDGDIVSEHGTFSACSSIIYDDYDYDDIDDDDGLSTCSVRTEDLFPTKNNQQVIVSTSTSTNSGGNGSITQPLSASICSTASTASSFVFDNHSNSNADHHGGDGENHHNRSSSGGHSHQRNRNGSTSTSSCSNRDLFLIDDEICDQPALLISGTNITTDAKQRINLLSSVGDETTASTKDWLVSPTKTLTPSTSTTTSSNAMTTISNLDSPSLAIPTSSVNPTTNFGTSTATSCESMLQSLNHELENLILQTTIDYQSLTPFDSCDPSITVSDSDFSPITALPVLSNHIENNNSYASQKHNHSTTPHKTKLRKHHSYTSSCSTLANQSSSTTNHKVPVFRRPRPLSFVENDDGSYGLDSPSLRAVAQDLIGIKTLLFRLQNILQNAETQNPFDQQHQQRRYSYDSSATSTKSSTPGSTTGSNSTSIGIMDHSMEETMQLLREENFDLSQHVQLMEQQIIEKDRIIRLLQQQMAKYTTNNNYNQISTEPRGLGSGFSMIVDFQNNFQGENNQKPFINSTTQTESQCELQHLLNHCSSKTITSSSLFKNYNDDGHHSNHDNGCS